MWSKVASIIYRITVCNLHCKLLTLIWTVQLLPQSTACASKFSETTTHSLLPNLFIYLFIAQVLKDSWSYNLFYCRAKMLQLAKVCLKSYSSRKEKKLLCSMYIYTMCVYLRLWWIYIFCIHPPLPCRMPIQHTHPTHTVPQHWS